MKASYLASLWIILEEILPAEQVGEKLEELKNNEKIKEAFDIILDEGQRIGYYE